MTRSTSPEFPWTSSGCRRLRNVIPPKSRRSGSKNRGTNRISSDTQYYPVWEKFNLINGLAYEADTNANPYRGCAWTGYKRYIKAHVFPCSDVHTYHQEKYGMRVGILPTNDSARCLLKTSFENRIPLYNEFAGVMEPEKSEFFFFPTLTTILCLIRVMEERLVEAEKAKHGSFKGFRADAFLDHWETKIEVNDESINVFEYDGMFWGDTIQDMVIRRYIAKTVTYEKAPLLGPREVPDRFAPEIPPITLPLDPFIVVLVSMYSLRRRMQEANPSFKIRDDVHHRIFVLGEYLLRLVEVETASAFRDLPRPELDFRLRRKPANPDPTHRWNEPPSDKSIERVNKKRRKGDSSSSSDDNKARRTLSSAVKMPSDSENESGLRRSTRARGRQRVGDDDETMSSSSSSSSTGVPSPDLSQVPSPALTQSGNTTPSEASVEWIPTLRRSPYEFDDESTDDSCTPTPPVFAPTCPFSSLEEWMQDTEQKKAIIREEAFPPPRGLITSPWLRQLRLTFDPAGEAEMLRLKRLGQHIEMRIADRDDTSEDEPMRDDMYVSSSFI